MILNAKEILKQLYNCCDLIEERLLDGDEKPGCDLRKQLLKDTASFAARVSARKTITVFKRTDGQKRHGGSVATCLL